MVSVLQLVLCGVAKSVLRLALCRVAKSVLQLALCVVVKSVLRLTLCGVAELRIVRSFFSTPPQAWQVRDRQSDTGHELP